jgi:hypothetical protein
MEKNLKIGILVIALVITTVFLTRYFDHRGMSPVNEAKVASVVPVPKPPANFCENPTYTTEKVEMKDDSMKGLIESGEKYSVTQNWYKCNPVKRGDIVDYVFNYNQPSVPRVVHAIPGDKFKLVKDKKRKAWNLSINGKVIMNPGHKEPHYFGNEAPSILGLYEKSMKGVLAPTTFIVFSTVSPGTHGSEMGVVNSQDFRGKVQVLEKIDTQPKGSPSVD